LQTNSFEAVEKEMYKFCKENEFQTVEKKCNSFAKKMNFKPRKICNRSAIKIDKQQNPVLLKKDEVNTNKTEHILAEI